MELLNGAIVVDKPVGWTSHDVVAKMRRIANTKKIGHLGTLDPNATGVLPLLLGRATRLAQFFGRADKRYEGTVRFGYATDTWDIEGKPLGADVPVDLDSGHVGEMVQRFVGRLQQVPPPVSAKKIGGVPAYKLARANQRVELKPCAVEVYSIEVLRCEGNELDLRVHCSAGTYLRSIAHELGILAGPGAFLKSLRRTGSGSFDIASARTLEQLQELANQDRLGESLVRGAELLPEMPAEFVDAPTAGFIRQGRDFRVNPFRVGSGASLVKAVDPEGELIAIGEAKLPHVYHPILVL